MRLFKHSSLRVWETFCDDNKPSDVARRASRGVMEPGAPWKKVCTGNAAAGRQGRTYHHYVSESGTVLMVVLSVRHVAS